MYVVDLNHIYVRACQDSQDSSVCFHILFRFLAEIASEFNMGKLSIQFTLTRSAAALEHMQNLKSFDRSSKKFKVENLVDWCNTGWRK